MAATFAGALGAEATVQPSLKGGGRRGDDRRRQEADHDGHNGLTDAEGRHDSGFVVLFASKTFTYKDREAGP